MNSLILIAMLSPGAQNDNTVEWNGVFSHSGYRGPASPGKNQSFAVELRVFKNDLTGARVRTWDGAETFYSMSWNRNEGSFDIWRATVAGTSANFLYYYFDLADPVYLLIHLFAGGPPPPLPWPDCGPKPGDLACVSNCAAF